MHDSPSSNMESTPVGKHVQRDDQQFDEHDEVLLLQLALVGECGPGAPGIEGHSNMERPPSSGLDMTTTSFSFAKPANHGKKFTVAPPSRPMLSRGSAAPRESPTIVDQNPSAQIENRDVPITSEKSLAMVPHPKVTKRRRSTSRMSEQAKQQLSPRVAIDPMGHLTEDDLFRLLMRKMRQKEENEAATARKLVDLKNENSLLRKKVLAAANLKAKISKFKGLLNNLGNDFRALRESELGASHVSLSAEREELMQSILEAKTAISRAFESHSQSRSQLEKVAQDVMLLSQSLQHSESMASDARQHLADEKRRCGSLESYIQNSCRDQAVSLDQIQAQQAHLNDKLANMLEAVNQQTAGTTSLQSILQTQSDELAMLRELLAATEKSRQAEAAMEARIREELSRVEAAAEARLREELSRASVIARHQLQASHEQQIHQKENELQNLSSTLAQRDAELERCRSSEAALREEHQALQDKLREMEQQVKPTQSEQQPQRNDAEQLQISNTILKTPSPNIRHGPTLAPSSRQPPRTATRRGRKSRGQRPGINQRQRYWERC